MKQFSSAVIVLVAAVTLVAGDVSHLVPQQQPQQQAATFGGFNPAQFQLTQQQLQAQQQQFAQNEPVAPVGATPVTDICLGCICQMMSNCNQSLSCNGEVCGLFRITRPYWIDAQKPVQQGDHADNPGAFENCVNEPICAARTVQNYMLKFQQDCNQDGQVNCYDHAIIHNFGGYGCTNSRLDDKKSTTFEQCLASAQNYQG